MAFKSVDLNNLPAPLVVEDFSFEDILADMKAVASNLLPALAPVLQLESEPATKILEVCAFYVMLTRSRVNDSARALMLAYSRGADLDNLGALFGVERKIIVEAQDDAPAVYESDNEFRARIQSSLEGFSTAGPIGAYEFHALSASSEVRDVFVAGASTPHMVVAPGTVEVYLLGRTGDGTVGPAVVATVNAALNAETIRPLCDTVIVRSATIQPYAVAATLKLQGGPDASVVLAAARAALDTYLAQVHRIGAVVAISGIHAALHQAGVEKVTVTQPAADIVPLPNVAPFATGSTITIQE